MNIKKYYGIILASVILLFSIFLITFPKMDFSENENRYLDEFPKFNFTTLKDGSFMLDLEKYVQDHFPYRDIFVNMKSKIEMLQGKTENNNVYICDNGYLMEKNTVLDENRLERISKIINNFAKNNLDANISVMIAPTSITINSDLLPEYATQYSEPDRISTIYSNLENCTTIDVKDTLQKLNDSGIQCYYKLDHHWTTRAAFEAYLEYANTINIPALSLQDFDEEIVTNEFYGTTYSKANIYDLTPDKITTYTHKTNNFDINYVKQGITSDSFYNKDYLEKKDKYAMFLNENQELIIIKNKSINSNKNILIIKDSYANCFVPFIANNFKTTHVIDPRYYVQSITEYVKENNIDEILFLYNIHTLVTDQGIFNVR